MSIQEPSTLISDFETIENLHEMAELINYIINLSHTIETSTIHIQQLFQSLDTVQTDIEAIKEQLKHLP